MATKTKRTPLEDAQAELQRRQDAMTRHQEHAAGLRAEMEQVDTRIQAAVVAVASGEQQGEDTETLKARRLELAMDLRDQGAATKALQARVEQAQAVLRDVEQDAETARFADLLAQRRALDIRFEELVAQQVALLAELNGVHQEQMAIVRAHGGRVAGRSYGAGVGAQPSYLASQHIMQQFGPAVRGWGRLLTKEPMHQADPLARPLPADERPPAPLVDPRIGVEALERTRKEQGDLLVALGD